MAFDETLAARIRDALARRKGVEEKKMFGCICFLINGNALAGVWKDSLIARLGPDEGEAALREPHVRAFDITGEGEVAAPPGEFLDRAGRAGCSHGKPHFDQDLVGRKRGGHGVAEQF